MGGTIRCYRTLGGSRRFPLIEIEQIISADLTGDLEGVGASGSLNGSKTAIYARVSSYGQKKKGI